MESSSTRDTAAIKSRTLAQIKADMEGIPKKGPSEPVDVMILRLLTLLIEEVKDLKNEIYLLNRAND